MDALLRTGRVLSAVNNALTASGEDVTVSDAPQPTSASTATYASASAEGSPYDAAEEATEKRDEAASDTSFEIVQKS